MKLGSHFTSNGFAVLSLALISLSSYTCGQIQCPAAFVQVFPNGTADFESLPPGDQDIDPVYDPGAIGGWYDLAVGFVDTVRPGNLPYSQIRDTLEENNLPCSNFPESPNCVGQQQEGSFDAQETLRSFSTWWVGLIIVTIIGGLLGCGFCISGLCFCCCRCCGNCGGKRSQQIGENMDCKTFTFTIILSLVLVLLFVGVVLAFFSNQQTFDSVGNTQTAINNVVSDGTTYINETIEELEQLVCQIASTDGIAGNVIQEARNFNTTLQDYVNDLEREVDMIGDTITAASPGLNMTLDVLGNLSTINDALMASGNMLVATLNAINMDVMSSMTLCSSITPPIPLCSMISGATFETAKDFNQLPSVQQPLDDVRDAIENINFDSLVSEGRNTFNEIRRTIDSEVTANIDEALREVDSYNGTLFEIVNNVTSMVQDYIQDDIRSSECPGSFFDVLSSDNLQTNVGYFRECIINGAFSEIQQYDTYRYAFGIVICSLALVTVIVGLVGIVMGMFGFRKNRDPDQRTTLSHCGGVFLILGVILTFVFGFILLILCSIFFFFGANVQKMCQSIEYPNYPLFVELVDNSSFWGGSLIGLYLDPDDPPEVYISEALKNCRSNTGLYSAANLSFLLPTRNITTEINNRINLDEIRRTLDDALRNATNSFTFNSTSFLPADVQASLEEFRNASVDQIDIDAFRQQIDADLLLFDIDEEISNSMSLSSQLSMLQNPPTNIIALVDGTTNNLIAIRNQIPMIQGQVDMLEAEVDELVQLTDTVVMETNALVDEIAEVIDNITGQSLPEFLDTVVAGALDQVFGLLDTSIAHIDDELAHNVGGCFPLWSIYTQLYNTACQDFIEGLNGFWWSLGFCAILFIPVIVFSVITSNFYLKKKNEVEGYSGYDDFPLKSY